MHPLCVMNKLKYRSLRETLDVTVLEIFVWNCKYLTLGFPSERKTPRLGLAIKNSSSVNFTLFHILSRLGKLESFFLKFPNIIII